MAINVGSAIAYLELDTSQFRESIRGAGEDLERFATGDSVEKLVSGLVTIRSTITDSLAESLINLEETATIISRNFEFQMSKIKYDSGMISEEFTLLSEQTLELGMNISFSANEAAIGMDSFAGVGVKTYEIMSAMPDLLSLTTNCGIDMAAASNIAGNSLSSFSLEVEKAAYATDSINQISVETNIGITAVGEGMNEVTSAAGKLGFSFADIAISMSNMEISVASSIVGLDICISEFKESITGAGETLKSFADETIIGNLVGGLTTTGSIITDIITKPLVSLDEISTMISRNFDGKMIRIKNSARVTGEEFANLHEQALKLGNITSSSTIKVANVITKISAGTNIGITTIREGMKTVSPTVEQVGVKFKETAIAVTSFSNIGIKVSEIFTSIFTSLGRPAGNASKKLRELNINFIEIHGKIAPIGEAIYQLQNKTKELIVQQRASIVEIILIKDAITVMLPSLEQVRERFDELSKTFRNCDAATKELARIIKYNLKVTLDMLKEISETSATKIGIELVSAIRKAIDAIAQLISKFHASSSAVQESTEKMNSIRKVINPVISKIKQIISVIEDWIKKIKKLIEILKFIKSVAGLFSKLSKLVGILGKVISAVQKVISFVEKLIGIVKKVIGAFDSLEAAASVFAEIAASIGPEVLIIIAIIAGIGLIVYEVIKHWDDLKAYFNGLWNYFRELGGNIVDGFSNGIKEAGKKFDEVMEWLGQKIIDPFKSFLGINSPSKLFENFGIFIVDGLINGLKNGWNRLKEGVSGLANLVSSVFATETETHSPSQVFVRFGNYIGDGLVVGLGEREEHVSNKIKNITDKIKNIGSVSPELKSLNNLDLKGDYKLSSQIQEARSSRQVNFTPNITMHISVSDTGAKGTAQLASELKSMAQNAIKNSMVDEFMADALRL